MTTKHMPQPVSVDRAVVDRLTVVCPKNGLPAFLAEIAARVDCTHNGLTLDMSESTALDYLSIQSLLLLRRECQRAGIGVVLKHVNENNRRRLDLSGASTGLSIDSIDQDLLDADRIIHEEARP